MIKPKHLKITLIAIVLLIIVLIIIILTSNSKITNYEFIISNECDQLASKFDKLTVEGPYSPYDLKWGEGFVGGTLIQIESYGFRGTPYNFYFYELIFKGNKKIGKIGLITNSDNIPYKINNFYKFDLNERQGRFAPMPHQGSYVDKEFKLLEKIEC